MLNDTTIHALAIFGFGWIVGFVLGYLFHNLRSKQQIRSNDILAWTLAMVWLIWHIMAGLHIGVQEGPPWVFDLVAGSAVGMLLGDKFFDYFKLFRK